MQRIVLGLVAVASIAAVVVGIVLFSGGDEEKKGHAPIPPPSRALQIGITEPNANFLWSRASKPDLPNGFWAWRDRLAEIAPSYYRLTINWAEVQPQRDRPPDWDLPNPGCMRAVPPCASYRGVREQLKAIASQQRAGKQFSNVLVVPLYAPEWATEKNPPGCVRPNADPRSFAIASDAIPAYKKMIASFLRVAEEEKVEIKWISPWNEPNHPGFITPQRDSCSRDGKTLAPAVYTRLARALMEVLEREGGDQKVELGELAGYERPRKYSAGAVEFLRQLPDDVVCAGTVWGQHAYVGNRRNAAQEAKGGEDYAADADLAGSAKLLDDLESALDERKCSEQKRIWITETGVGGSRAGAKRPIDPASLNAGCQAMNKALHSWYENPRVDVAFQYTFRQDDLFPVGLVDTNLSRTFPTFFLWRAWGQRKSVSDLPADNPC